jgi:negative regulator of sigma-B (phosphoserine phosphatase)
VGIQTVSDDEAAFVEVGVASWSLEPDCGDAYVAQPFDHGLLIAVIDGLGHGRHAADAAQLAVATLIASPGEDLATLLRECHARLGGSRGAVISLARICDDGTVGWAGVGNVAGALMVRYTGEPWSRLLTRAGVVGHKLPDVGAASLTMSHGDAIVLSSDGVRSAEMTLDPSTPAQANAERLLADNATRRDDALVLVARYTGLRR